MSRKTRKNAFLGSLQAGICYAILFTVISVAEAREACDLKGRLFRVFLFFLSRTTPITGVIAYAQQYTIKVR